MEKEKRISVEMGVEFTFDLRFVDPVFLDARIDLQQRYSARGPSLAKVLRDIVRAAPPPPQRTNIAAASTIGARLEP